MSTPSENEMDLELHFLPAWAKQAPDVNRYANFKGESEDRPRRDSFGGRGGPGGGGERRGPRRDGPPPRRDGGAPRPGGPVAGGARPGGRSFGGPRPAGPGGDRGGFRGRSGGPRRDDRRDERREPLAPLPELKVELLPEEAGVDSIARQIKLTGRAYPLFEIAALILKKPERYHAQFTVVKKPDGTIAQPLFVCSLDDTVWLSEAEAVAHVLTKHFNTFYQAERSPCDPPKGIYTFVAQCGFSGVILGPPNYHDYQNKLRKLHAERFGRMPFDAFKARVKIVKDEEVVKKWVEEQSFKTEFICLNVPEAPKLPNREEVEKHFRATHLPNVIRQVESHTLTTAARREVRSPGLQALMRRAWDEQAHFPLKMANTLSKQFAHDGLSFFKVNKTVTHVSVARPHFLDLEATPVSDGVKKIIDFINSKTKCTRRDLLNALAPAPKPVEAPAPAPAAEGAPAAPVAPATPEQTPEQAAVTSDLHWLIHQGHVIEFANGRLETAKKPMPRPEKAPKAGTPAAAAAPTAEANTVEIIAPAAVEAAVASESPSAVAPVSAEHAPEAPAQENPPA